MHDPSPDHFANEQAGLGPSDGNGAPKPTTRSPHVDKAGRALCPYCGRVGANPDRCEHCRGLFDHLSRQATQNQMGPWRLWRDTHPHHPGVSFDVMRDLVARRKITRGTIVCGPTTRQFWSFACNTAGIAVLLGECHSCHEKVRPDNYMCPRCHALLHPKTDRQTLGLAPVRPLPGEAPPETIASAALGSDPGIVSSATSAADGSPLDPSEALAQTSTPLPEPVESVKPGASPASRNGAGVFGGTGGGTGGGAVGGAGVGGPMPALFAGPAPASGFGAGPVRGPEPGSGGAVGPGVAGRVDPVAARRARLERREARTRKILIASLIATFALLAAAAVLLALEIAGDRVSDDQTWTPPASEATEAPGRPAETEPEPAEPTVRAPAIRLEGSPTVEVDGSLGSRAAALSELAARARSAETAASLRAVVEEIEAERASARDAGVGATPLLDAWLAELRAALARYELRESLGASG